LTLPLFEQHFSWQSGIHIFMRKIYQLPFSLK
jgi:hypothetical protein